MPNLCPPWHKILATPLTVSVGMPANSQLISPSRQIKYLVIFLILVLLLLQVLHGRSSPSKFQCWASFNTGGAQQNLSGTCNYTKRLQIFGTQHTPTWYDIRATMLPDTRRGIRGPKLWSYIISVYVCQCQAGIYLGPYNTGPPNKARQNVLQYFRQSLLISKNNPYWYIL